MAYIRYFVSFFIKENPLLIINDEFVIIEPIKELKQLKPTNYEEYISNDNTEREERLMNNKEVNTRDYDKYTKKSKKSKKH